jgi:hypothetical protein
VYSRQLGSIIILGLFLSLGALSGSAMTNSLQVPSMRRSFTPSDAYDLQFSTYLGSTGFDLFREMVVDDHGDIYLVGETESEDFPTTEDAFDRSNNGGTEWAPWDGFIMKLSGDGLEIIYSTYLGGSGDDAIFDIVVDEEGSAYVAGQTTSDDLPTVNAYDASYNGGEDCFIAKLSPNGSKLEFLTYVGGSGDDCAFSLDIDSSGDCIVVGRTASTDFPVLTTNNQASCHSLGDDQDGFVFMLSDDGNSLEYSMYLGGDFNDEPLGINSDTDGNVVIVGSTGASNFPLVNPLDDTLGGIWDCFIIKLNASGHFLFSTYYGGSGIEYASEVSVDELGQITVAGIMKGGNFPIVGVNNVVLNGTWGVFLLIMNSIGTEATFSGVIENSGADESTTTVRGLVVHSAHEIWITGGTKCSGFPVTDDAFDREFKIQEGYITWIDLTSCTLNYSSFFGGGGLEYCTGLGITSDGDIICAGNTDSSDIPTLNAIEPNKLGSGNDDGFAFKLVKNETTSTTTMSSITSATSSTYTSMDMMYIALAGVSLGVIALVIIMAAVRHQRLS